MSSMVAGWRRAGQVRVRRFFRWDRLAGVAALLAVRAVAVRGGRRRPDAGAPPALCATPGSMPTSTRARSTRRTSPSPRSTRSGPTAPPSGAGSRCRPAPPSTPPTPTPGCSRSARGSGRSSPSAAARSRPAISSGWPTAAWLYAAYAWSADGREADARARGAASAAPSTSAAAGRTRSRRSATARSATSRGGTPVLGFGLLQLSPDRDPGALHAEPPPAPASTSPTSSRAGLLVGPAAGASRDAAAHRGRDADGAGGARLPARQLRPLPQRRRPARERRPLPAPRDRRRRWSRGARRTVGRPVRTRRPGQSPDARAADRPRAPGAQRARRAHGLALGGAADAAARHRAGRTTEALDLVRQLDRRAGRFTSRRPNKGGTRGMRRSHRMLLAAAALARGRAPALAQDGDAARRQVPGRHLRVPRLPHALAHGPERAGARHEPGALRPPAGLRDRGRRASCPSPGSAAWPAPTPPGPAPGA